MDKFFVEIEHGRKVNVLAISTWIDYPDGLNVREVQVGNAAAMVVDDSRSGPLLEISIAGESISLVGDDRERLLPALEGCVLA